MRQQPEAIDEHTGFLRHVKDVFDDHVEALATEPVERLEHLAFPPGCHVHLDVEANVLRLGARLAGETADAQRRPGGHQSGLHDSSSVHVHSPAESSYP